MFVRRTIFLAVIATFGFALGCGSGGDNYECLSNDDCVPGTCLAGQCTTEDAGTDVDPGDVDPEDSGRDTTPDVEPDVTIDVGPGDVEPDPEPDVGPEECGNGVVEDWEQCDPAQDIALQYYYCSNECEWMQTDACTPCDAVGGECLENGSACVNGICERGCENDFECEEGFCYEGQCQLPPDYCYCGPEGCGGEICDDGVDNNGDLAVDCEDFECFEHSWCTGIEDDCFNEHDDDGDGATDCDDDDCAWLDECIHGGSEVCDDWIDNDGDGLVDCADRDCGVADGCREYELCDDWVDNDADGLHNCGDEECFLAPECVLAEDEDCGDFEDNDLDLLWDCEDPDCVGASDCQ